MHPSIVNRMVEITNVASQFGVKLVGAVRRLYIASSDSQCGATMLSMDRVFLAKSGARVHVVELAWNNVSVEQRWTGESHVYWSRGCYSRDCLCCDPFHNVTTCEATAIIIDGGVLRYIANRGENGYDSGLLLPTIQVYLHRRWFTRRLCRRACRGSESVGWKVRATIEARVAYTIIFMCTLVDLTIPCKSVGTVSFIVFK